MTTSHAPLSPGRIREVLHQYDTGTFGADLHYVPRIGSTNDLARKLAAEDAPTGTIVLTDEQTAGRGRQGRTWSAPEAQALLMSVILRPGIAPAEAYRMVMVVGLGVADACDAHAGQAVTVKWPNDLMIGGKKIGGILPESAVEGERLNWVVVGMGLNVNQTFGADDPLHGIATSLRVESGIPVDREDLFGRVMARINYWYTHFRSGRLLDAWQGRSATLGQLVQIQAGGEIIKGTAQSIDDRGTLQVMLADGSARTIAFGEATVLREEADD